MRRAAKVDTNQKEIVNLLRRLGYSVRCLHRVGDDFPDIIFADDENHIAEIKHGKKKLSEGQLEFQVSWKGPIQNFRSLDDVLAFHQKRRERFYQTED